MFQSFFWGGFECATGYNVQHQWIDQVRATRHDECLDEDYRLLRELGIATAREAIRWPLVDVGGQYDFTTVAPVLAAARRHGIQLVFDLFHFGYPDDMDIFSDAFPPRFADYCYVVSQYIGSRVEGTCYFTPINEPSYFAWAAGDAARFAPHQTERSWELKVNLARACIQGINAIREACPRARIVNVDSICRVVAPLDRPEWQIDADNFNKGAVFQSFDMISGRLLPELGGSPAHLDIAGFNYYWTNQWELGREGIPLADDDPRRVPLRTLIQTAYERYHTEIALTETSHVGERRAGWLREVGREAVALLREGVPLRGVCIYPVLGMPEWHTPEQWARMGLWDLDTSDGLGRMPVLPMINALRIAQRMLSSRVPNAVVPEWQMA